MSDTAIEYSLPGVLHYLQAEWRKFEREKNEWVIERAELKVNSPQICLKGKKKRVKCNIGSYCFIRRRKTRNRKYKDDFN